MRKLREIVLKAALIAAAVITGGILLFLIGIILKRGVPQLTWSFLTTATSYLAGTTGILPNICNTLYLILIAMGVALPPRSVPIDSAQASTCRSTPWV